MTIVSHRRSSRCETVTSTCTGAGRYFFDLEQEADMGHQGTAEQAIANVEERIWRLEQ